MAAIQPQQTKPVIDRPAPNKNVSPSLKREVLADIVDLALTAGQLLMQNGAESQRVEETVRRVATHHIPGTGAGWHTHLEFLNNQLQAKDRPSKRSGLRRLQPSFRR